MPIADAARESGRTVCIDSIDRQSSTALHGGPANVNLSTSNARARLDTRL